MKACNQLCPWNTPYGCKKPESKPCILSNMACEKFEPKPQTNADHIRSMTDEELANFLTDHFNGGWVTEVGRQICYERISDWLREPYKEEL